MDLVEKPDGDFARHPWEVVRAEFFRGVLGPVLQPLPQARLLDVGAGDGWFSAGLLEQHAGLEIACYDPGYEDVPGATTPPDRPRQTFSATPPDGRFDALVLLDVLEHIEFDLDELRTLVEAHTDPGAAVLVSVPAWQGLFASHDVALHHFRRYSPAVGRAVLERAGLEIERSGGLFHALMLARALDVTRERLRGATSSHPRERSLAWSGPDLARRAVEGVLRGESRLSAAAADRGVGIPGLSWWALCRRR